MADLIVTGSSVIASSQAKTQTGKAGAAITAGQPIYEDVSDGNRMKPCDASAEASANAKGVALHDAADEQPITYATKDPDFTPGATVAAGAVYCPSATAGGVAPVADLLSTEWVKPIMVGNSTSKVKLDCESGLMAAGAIA